VIGGIIDGGDLLRVIWLSLASGLGVTTAYAVAIVGASRAVELRRDRRPVEAVVFAIVGVVALAAVLAAIVLGIVALADK
jgi:1-deoxy-D-xylulose 5-phosphate reductoisomerase